MTRTVKAFLLVLFFVLLAVDMAKAQQVNMYWKSGTSNVFQDWQPVATANPLPVTGTVTATNPVGITPTDRTIASTSGSSQTLMNANAARHSMTIENTGNANCGVNPTGGTASIGGAGTITLAPLGSYTPRIPTLSAVTVICTGGQPIYADEN